MELFRPEAILFEPVGTLLVVENPNAATGDARRLRAEARTGQPDLRLTAAPGAHDLLDELAADQVLLAVVSGFAGGARSLAAELERHGLRRSFPCIVASSDSELSGASAAPLREALRRLRVPAARAWHVGSDFAADVTHAAAAGLRPLWLDASDASPPGATPHQRISSLDALLALYLESQGSR